MKASVFVGTSLDGFIDETKSYHPSGIMKDEALRAEGL